MTAGRSAGVAFAGQNVQFVGFEGEFVVGRLVARVGFSDAAAG